jgi:hypothetical protein
MENADVGDTPEQETKPEQEWRETFDAHAEFDETVLPLLKDIREMCAALNVPFMSTAVPMWNDNGYQVVHFETDIAPQEIGPVAVANQFQRELVHGGPEGAMKFIFSVPVFQATISQLVSNSEEGDENEH